VEKLPLKALIVGCGRSGTGFLADGISQAGTQCGHEQTFNVYGINRASNQKYESSWYAVPFMDQISTQCRILHVVRHPLKVINSFYRIGLCSSTVWRHATFGDAPKYLLTNMKSPSKIWGRYEYALAHRNFLKKATRIFDERNELDRLELYWLSWNLAIQKSARKSGSKYLCVRLEDIYRRSDEISGFLGVPLKFSESTYRNKKPNYKVRTPPKRELKHDTIIKAREFGYDIKS
jgi:hypothetical protein